MPVDNEWYHDLGDAWWDPDGVVGPLHEINPVRVEYFCGVLGDLAGQRLLEIGCGGGLMAEEYARRGASVTAVDRSAASIAVAAQHARSSGLKIAYTPSVGERLPFSDGSFDEVLSAETLWHGATVNAVVTQPARVLATGGRSATDRGNRTWKSRLLLVWLPQNVFHIAPPDTHDYARFIKPEELRSIMARHGLQHCETRGLALKQNPIAAGISFARTRKLGGFQIGDDTGMSYVGYAEKAA